MGRLDNISQYSKPKKELPDKVDADDFVKLFQQVYESDDVVIQVDKEKIRDVPFFTMPELKYAVKKMKNRKSEDMSHIVAELIKHADGPFFGILLDMYNSILTTGNTPSNWHETVFRMLPKTGDLSDANNWRPIAVLPILYKIFSKLIYA